MPTMSAKGTSPDSSKDDPTLPQLKKNDPEADDPEVTDKEMAALEDHMEMPLKIQTLHKDMSQSAETAITTCKKMETPENRS